MTGFRGVLATARMEFHQALLSRVSLVLGGIFVLLVAGGTRAVAMGVPQQFEPFVGSAVLMFALTVIVALFGPIVPIAGSVLTVVEERSTRTIDLLLSRPVTRRGLLVGKLAGRAAAMACITYAGIVVGVLLVLGDLQPSLGDLVVLASLVALLCVTWVSLAVLLSTFVRTPTMALLAAFGVWILFLAWGAVGGLLLGQVGLGGLVPLLNPNTLFLGAVDQALGLAARLPGGAGAQFTTALTQGLDHGQALPLLLAYALVAALLAVVAFDRQDEAGGA